MASCIGFGNRACGGWIYGPYVNHNHYAGLMEMLVPIPLIVSLTRLAPPKVRAVAAAAAAVMVGTIFLSGSRGGMLAIVVELVILASLLVKQKRGRAHRHRHRRFSRYRRRIAGLDRRQRTQPAHRNRRPRTFRTLQRHSHLYQSRWPAHVPEKANPGLGSGNLSRSSIREFRTFYTNFFVNEAHNDYLQLLVEMGLLGFATMVWFVVTLYTRRIKKIGNWPGEMSGAMTLACLLGVSGILVHSAVDFNLQIPANAALFYVLCTMAAVRTIRQAGAQTPRGAD